MISMKGYSMKSLILLMIVAAVGAILFITGCEIGTNPVILDGSPITADLRIDGTSNILSDSLSVNLGDALSGIDKEVDSIRIFNITLLIDSTDTGVIAQGGLRLDNDTVLTLVGTPLSAFATERSIFDPKLKTMGFSYDSTIVLTLQQLLRQKPQPVVHIAFGILSSPLHFTAHLKIYTQVFAMIKN
jgi:hypothetical protein